MGRDNVQLVIYITKTGETNKLANQRYICLVKGKVQS